MSTRVAFSGTDEEIKAAMKNWLGTSGRIPSPAASTGQTLSISQQVINLTGQTKALYDRLEALETALGKLTTPIPQTLLDEIKTMKDEITKNKDSVNQNHLDFNEFLKTHPTDEEIDAKVRIINNLINELKTTQANAQLLINSNKATLDKLKNVIVPSHFRRLFRIVKGDSPSYNATDNILVFSKKGDILTLELPISDEATDNGIILNNADPYPFYIAEYLNTSDPLRARLAAGGLDFQVKGSNAKVEVYCTSDNPEDIGIFEWVEKWHLESI